MKRRGQWVAIGVLVGIGGYAYGKPLAIKGKVIDDSQCGVDASAPDCAGLPAAVIYVRDDQEDASDSSKLCSDDQLFLAKSDSQSGGAFDVTVDASKLKKRKTVRLDICLLKYLPAPNMTPRKTAAQGPLVVRLTPVVQTEAEAATYAMRLNVRASSQISGGRPLESNLQGEWTRLEKLGYPPEARALLAGALLKEAPAAASVAAIRTYGSVKLGDINGFRDRLKASLDASSCALSAEGQKSAKILPAAVTQDVLLHEARKPGQREAVIKLMQSMPADRRFDLQLAQ
jgi:hypothetical protein